MKHVGRKCQIVGYIIFWFGIVASLLAGLSVIRGAYYANLPIYPGILLLVGGVIGSFLLCIVLCAIGETHENTEKILEYLRIDNNNRLAQLEQMEKRRNKRVTCLCGTVLTTQMKVCPKCKEQNPIYVP